MTFFTTIQSFTNIFFDSAQKPLVICDIDHTFLKNQFSLNQVITLLNSHPKYRNNFLMLYQDAVRLMELSYNAGFICQTDPVGFQQMVNIVRALNGKIIFLTARNHIFHEKTLEDLTHAGLQHPEEYEIHYTNNLISKGEYLRGSTILDAEYTHVLFIDDNQQYLESVYHIFPNIHCYKFSYV
jgi:predicted secreted acid phosphatase